MDGTMFCNDVSMDSVMASPASQMGSKYQNNNSTPDKSSAPRQANNAAVVYSNEYTAKKSLDELFDLEKNQKGKPMRMRNLPGTFFDQASASSSASQSRDSLDSANFNSPKRTSMVPDGASAHLSLKRNQAKAKPMDPLSSFDSKTRSLPCSFSPRKFDPNSFAYGAGTLMPKSNLNANAPTKGQLESFTELQQGLMNQNRLKSTDTNPGGQTMASTATSSAVTAATGQLAPNIFNINPGNASSVQGQFFQQVHPSTMTSQQQQQLMAAQVALQQNNQLATQMQHQQLQQFGQSPVTRQGMVMQDQSKDENFLHGLQQLENERANMKKRQLELLNAKLIGPNTNQSRAAQMMHPSNNNSLINQPPVYEIFQRGQQIFVGKPQSRQESIDSGLDLLCCYSSSTESTNRVSPELFLQLGNGSVVAASAAHLMDSGQQYNGEQFGPALSHKLMTSQAATTTSTSGLFVGSVASTSSNADIVAQVTNGNLGSSNFGRVKPSGPGVSGLCSTGDMATAEGIADNSTNYLTFPTNNGSLLNDYIDSMSIASSPNTLDGTLNSETGTTGQSTGRSPMTPSADSLALNQMQSGSLYDDSFINSLLSGSEHVDLLDFNGNFTNVSGYAGMGTDGCDLQTGFL